MSGTGSALEKARCKFPCMSLSWYSAEVGDAKVRQGWRVRYLLSFALRRSFIALKSRDVPAVIHIGFYLISDPDFAHFRIHIDV